MGREVARNPAAGDPTRVRTARRDGSERGATRLPRRAPHRQVSRLPTLGYAADVDPSGALGYTPLP